MDFFYLASLEIFISIFLNLQVLDQVIAWQETFAKCLTFLFIAFEALFICFTLFLFFCKCKKESPVDRMKRWEDRFGTLYQGLTYEDAFQSRLQPIIFMAKRAFLAIGCFFIKSELIMMFQLIQMIHLGYLLHAMPHKERFASKTEIITESTILGLLYCLQAFKGDLLLPDVQYSVGWVAVLVLGQYISMHLVYNVYGTIKDIISLCKAKCCTTTTAASSPRKEKPT